MSFDSSTALRLEAPPIPALARQVLDGLSRARPLAELCQELAIPAATGERIVAKLRRLGLLAGARRGVEELAPRFSVEEEAFFAAEVQVDPYEEEERPGLWARALSLVR